MLHVYNMENLLYHHFIFIFLFYNRPILSPAKVPSFVQGVKLECMGQLGSQKVAPKYLFDWRVPVSMWPGSRVLYYVIKWKHFPRYWPFVRGIHRSTVNSLHKCQWRGALSFSLICARINGWVNNREAGNLRRHSAHYDVIVMIPNWSSCGPCQEFIAFLVGTNQTTPPDLQHSVFLHRPADLVTWLPITNRRWFNHDNSRSLFEPATIEMILKCDSEIWKSTLNVVECVQKLTQLEHKF